MDQTQ